MNIHPDTAKQMLAAGQISQDDFDAIINETPKRSKFNARRTEVDGITFDSKAESRRYSELKLLERSGEIHQLRTQVKYPLCVNGHNIATYIADFEYRTRGLVNELIVEDCKGVKTPVYRLKKKLVLAIYGINILETK